MDGKKVKPSRSMRFPNPFSNSKGEKEKKKDRKVPRKPSLPLIEIFGCTTNPVSTAMADATAEFDDLDEEETDALFEIMLNDMNLTDEKKEPLRKQKLSTKKELLAKKKYNDALESQRPEAYVIDLINRSYKNDAQLSKLLKGLAVNITTCPLSWIQEFQQSFDGLNVLLSVLRTCSKSVEGNENALLCMRCIRGFGNCGFGLITLVKHQSAATTIAHYLDSNYPTMMLLSVEILTSVALYSQIGHDKVMQGLTINATYLGERFCPIVRGISCEVLSLSCLQLLNVLVNPTFLEGGFLETDYRIELRLELNQIKLTNVLDSMQEIVDDDIHQQISIFRECADHDLNDLFDRCDGVKGNMTDSSDCYRMLSSTLHDTESDKIFLSILQQLLFVSDGPNKQVVYAVIDEIIHHIVFQSSGKYVALSSEAIASLDIHGVVERLAESNEETNGNVVADLQLKLDRALQEKEEAEATSDTWRRKTTSELCTSRPGSCFPVTGISPENIINQSVTDVAVGSPLNILLNTATSPMSPNFNFTTIQKDDFSCQVEFLKSIEKYAVSQDFTQTISTQTSISTDDIGTMLPVSNPSVAVTKGSEEMLTSSNENISTEICHSKNDIIKSDVTIPAPPPLPPGLTIPSPPPLPSGVMIPPPPPLPPGVMIPPPPPLPPGVTIPAPPPLPPGVTIPAPPPLPPGVTIPAPPPLPPGVTIPAPPLLPPGVTIPPPPPLPQGVSIPPAPLSTSGGNMLPPPPPPSGLPNIPARITLPFGMQPKKVYKTGTAMKKANWSKIIPSQLHEDSLWVNIHEDMASDKLFQFLEENFSTKPAKVVVDGSANFTKKVKQFRVLDSRTGQNLSILLGSFKVPYEEIRRRILEIDEANLSVNMIEQLIKGLPEAEQLDALAEFHEEYEDLPEPEQFGFIMSGIKQLFPRLKAILFKIKFQERLAEIKPEIVSLTETLSQIRKSSSIAKILELVLIVGNYMNSGSNNSQSLGFQINFLTKLTETKTKDGSKTLLVCLIDYAEKNFPECLLLPEELSYVDRAVRVSDDAVQENILDMKRCTNAIKSDLEKYTSQSKNDRFVEVMEEFVIYADDQIEILETMRSRMQEKFTELSRYLAFSVDKYSMKELFGDLKMFKDCFVKVLDVKKAARMIQVRTERGRLRQSGLTSSGQPLKVEENQSNVIDNLMEVLKSGTAFSRATNKSTSRDSSSAGFHDDRGRRRNASRPDWNRSNSRAKRAEDVSSEGDMTDQVTTSSHRAVNQHALNLELKLALRRDVS